MKRLIGELAVVAIFLIAIMLVMMFVVSSVQSAIVDSPSDVGLSTKINFETGESCISRVANKVLSKVKEIL